MNLSHQTVLLTFGVTLVHLVAIAALSPATHPSRISPPPLLSDDAFVGPADDSTPVPEGKERGVETRPVPVPDAAEPSLDPVALPARFRELPEGESAPSPDPVAETRPVPDPERMPRELDPLPSS